jgi:hypothetical protein
MLVDERKQLASWLTEDPRIKSLDRSPICRARRVRTRAPSSTGRRSGRGAAGRTPLYLPVSKTAEGHPIVLWREVQPAPEAHDHTHRSQVMQIQLDHSPTGAFKTVRQDTLTNRRGHFGMLQKFVGGGSVRLQWRYQSDGVQPYGDVAGATQAAIRFMMPAVGPAGDRGRHGDPLSRRECAHDSS